MQRTAIFSTCYSHTDYCLVRRWKAHKCLKWGRVCHCEPTPRGGDLWTLCCWRKKAASLACPRESAASRAKAVEDAFSLRAACTGSAPAEKPAAERQKVGECSVYGNSKATLAESFLSDLQELDEPEEQQQDAAGAAANQEEDEWEPIPDAVELYLSKKGGLVSSAVVSSLAEQPRFIKLLEQARELTPQAVAASGEELALIEECNQLVIDIDTDILAVHRFIRDIYSMKFPELESIVQAPLEYIAVVHRIQNQTDLTQVDLSDLLPSPMIMALTVAASLSISGSAGSNAANAGRRLPEEDLEKAITAAKEALALAERRKEVLQYLESRMSLVAPNVSAILGAALTARLLTKVGCLQSLAKMPAQNIMLVGSQKKGSLSLSTKGGASNAFSSLLCSSDLLIMTPPAYRKKALRLLAGKVALAARVDVYGSKPAAAAAAAAAEGREGDEETSDTQEESAAEALLNAADSSENPGAVGRALREGIVQALMKAQEPPPAPMKKALPAPDERSKPKRGGKRHRRLKEKQELSEVQKQLNRMKFGEQEDTVGLKDQRRQQQLRPKGGLSSAVSAAGTSTSTGFSSSLTFTPIQGIELCNPLAETQQQQQQQQDAKDYFGGGGRFTAVERNKPAARKA
ncbi:U4/U6 small nuclear ribonucleoprotein Prp31 homolog [Cyclospora cayetanensis]|uniref:U4/U6 small nuclear ribonucleoprotein Prp31 homolog n=1 Tax=Cyclospora cayetanensis TaxID=88456 RepID=A0A6P6RZ95_9EIME|nr:U4/U6 small nuclear ribonucleoprotein Prp31 homolog [Cyclospora cayetanensis]